MILNTEHPCFGCESIPTDHAIICAQLGVISSGRCKRIKRHEEAFNMLYGLGRMSHNSRKQIVIRSAAYFETLSEHYKPILAYKDGTLRLTLKSGARETCGPVRAISEQSPDGLSNAIRANLAEGLTSDP